MMDFIRALINNEEILTDAEAEKILEELEQLGDEEFLSEEAWARIEKRVTNRNLALYSLLIDKNKLMLAKRFVELSRLGKSIPSPMVQAYQPIIEMVDDIVTAGPGYVQMLKVLHKRAKRTG